MLEQTEVILAVVKAFDTLGIRYYLGGSWASGAVGKARMTADVDVVAEVRHQHVLPLVRMLEPVFYIDADMIREALHLNRSFNIIHLSYLYKVDVFINDKKKE